MISSLAKVFLSKSVKNVKPIQLILSKGFINTTYSSDPNFSIKNKSKIIEKYRKEGEENDQVNNFDDIKFNEIETQNVPQINSENKDSRRFLRKLLASFQSLDDPNVSIEEFTGEALKIKVGKKLTSYIFTAESDLIVMTSPISGFFKYTYDLDSGFWVSERDQHILDDLLIREFCKHSRGLLNIIN